jgi:16S rRNA (uracil1498-N3)-methyltransferase
LKRIFLDKDLVSIGERISIPADFTRHLKVLRVKPGQEFSFSTLKSQSGRLRVVDEKSLEILSLDSPNPPLPISALCAITKRSEDLIEKLSELGVESITFFEAERSVVKDSRKLERFEKIAKASASQSNRASPISIKLLGSLKLALSEIQSENKLVAALVDGATPLAAEIKPTSTAFAVGPEGDFTLDEYELLFQFGFKPVSLGNLVLRSETAALSMAATIANLLYSQKSG